MTARGQFARARGHQRAEKLEAAMDARSRASAAETVRTAYKQTLRDMLPLFLGGALPKGGDVISFAIRSMAEEIARYEPGRTRADIERELTAVAESPELRPELDAMVETRLQGRFDELVGIAREAIGKFETMDDVERLLRQIESSARSANFPKSWVASHLGETKSRLVAEYRAPRRQWEILGDELMDADVKHLKKAMRAERLEDFLRQGREIRESLSLTTLRDSKRGREALGILYVEALRQRLSQLLDEAEQPMATRLLQSKRSRLQAEFRRLGTDEQSARKREYDREMGRLGRLIKEGSATHDEAEAIFQRDPSVLKKDMRAFVDLWGEGDAEAIWQSFAQELVRRGTSWDKVAPRQERHDRTEVAYLPLYANWAQPKKKPRGQRMLY